MKLFDRPTGRVGWWTIVARGAALLLVPLAIWGALDLDRRWRAARADDPAYARLPTLEPEARQPPIAADGTIDRIPPNSLPVDADPAETIVPESESIESVSLENTSIDSETLGTVRPDVPPPPSGPPGLYEPLGLDSEELAARRAAPLIVDRSAPPPSLAPGGSSDIVYLDELRRRRLTVPVEGVDEGDLYDSFDDPRSGGRIHHALDIMAPRGTPVLAADHGTIARKHEGRLGGLSLYQVDRQGLFSYYYAHLDTYAPGLAEGDSVRRGQVLGTVGSTGNADSSAPHLHFAVYVLGPEASVWRGDPLNPFLIWND
ncbi:MAG: M23 family metallopeptidase [Acidobacteriota bacterium]